MIQRRPYSQAPAAVKALVAELEQSGDYLVYENDDHQPIVSIAPTKARRREAASKLRKLLSELPPSPYSEEETNALIEEAIAATKGQYPGDANAAAVR